MRDNWFRVKIMDNSTAPPPWWYGFAWREIDSRHDVFILRPFNLVFRLTAVLYSLLACFLWQTRLESERLKWYEKGYQAGKRIERQMIGRVVKEVLREQRFRKGQTIHGQIDELVREHLGKISTETIDQLCKNQRYRPFFDIINAIKDALGVLNKEIEAFNQESGKKG